MAVANSPLNAQTTEPSRRDFLFIATGAVGAVGAASVVVPLVSQMQPDAQVIAAGAPIDVDISAIAPGQQILVKWRGHPIFIVNRPPEALKTLQDPALVSKLSDPDSKVVQQPDYAENCHGSKYDLAGRVYSGVPAPYNLPVPPYTFTNDTTIRIGENPGGSTFDLANVVVL